MDRITFRNIKNKMIQALALMQEALDMSIPLLKSNQNNNIVMLWENFVKEFMGYIRHRSKESGVNLMSKISLRRIWLR
ncbi:MAG: hypothetical protein GX318_07285 [Clostridia bacterium]|nr:hypothetical protein [Clostridia bacterium]